MAAKKKAPSRKKGNPFERSAADMKTDKALMAKKKKAAKKGRSWK
jgi:hypothetical protein